VRKKPIRAVLPRAWRFHAEIDRAGPAFAERSDCDDTTIENAFAWDARRVWLHTCTYDHPNALTNYLKSGFKVFKVEEKAESIPKEAR
jgi:hypothetical protein